MSRRVHFRIRRVSAFALVLALAFAGFARTEEDRPERNRFAPDHLKCQYAGNLGFLSVGVGYSLLGGHLHSDLFYGYSPRGRSGESIHQGAWKNTICPRPLRLSKRVQWIPVTAGAHLSCKIGNNNRETWVILPDRYPDRYYPPTALHLLLTLGTSFDYLSPSSSRRAGVFFEAGTTALYLRNWVRESHVAFRDILNISFGVTRRF